MNRRLKNTLSALLVILVIVGLTGCGPTARQIKTYRPGEPYTGPQARLVVAPFTSRAPAASDRLAEGLSDMVTTALFATHRFILLDRENLGPADLELDRLRVRAQRLGAQLILTGAITEFNPDHLGPGGMILGAVTVGGSIIARSQWRDFPIMAASYLEADLSIDLKIIDVATGRVVAAEAVRAQSYQMAGGALIWVRQVGVPVVLGGLAGTAVEKAIRAAVAEVVGWLVEKTPPTYLCATDSPPKGETLVAWRPLSITPRLPRPRGRMATVVNNAGDLLIQIRAADPGYRGNPPVVDFSRDSVLVIGLDRPVPGCGEGLAKLVDRGPYLEAVIVRSCVRPEDLSPELKTAPPGHPARTVLSQPGALYYLIPKPNKEIRFTWRQ